MARVKRRSQARRGLTRLWNLHQSTHESHAAAVSHLATRFFCDFPPKFCNSPFWQRSTCFPRHFERAPARPRCPYRRSGSSRDPPVPPHSACAPRRPETARAPPRAPPGKTRRKAREGLTTRVWSAACSTLRSRSSWVTPDTFRSSSSTRRSPTSAWRSVSTPRTCRVACTRARSSARWPRWATNSPCWASRRAAGRSSRSVPRWS